MLLIFRNLLDMEYSDTMGVMRGTKDYTSLINETIQLCEIHKLSRLLL